MQPYLDPYFFKRTYFWIVRLYVVCTWFAGGVCSGEGWEGGGGGAGGGWREGMGARRHKCLFLYFFIYLFIVFLS